MGVPPNGWFLMEHPSINGWFGGYPYFRKPPVKSIDTDTAFPSRELTRDMFPTSCRRWPDWFKAESVENPTTFPLSKKRCILVICFANKKYQRTRHVWRESALLSIRFPSHLGTCAEFRLCMLRDLAIYHFFLKRFRSFHDVHHVPYSPPLGCCVTVQWSSGSWSFGKFWASDAAALTPSPAGRWIRSKRLETS